MCHPHHWWPACRLSCRKRRRIWRGCSAQDTHIWKQWNHVLRVRVMSNLEILVLEKRVQKKPAVNLSFLKNAFPQFTYNPVLANLALFSPGFRLSSSKSSWLSSLSAPEEEFTKLSFPESHTVIRTLAGTLFTKTPTWIRGGCWRPSQRWWWCWSPLSPSWRWRLSWTSLSGRTMASKTVSHQNWKYIFCLQLATSSSPRIKPVEYLLLFPFWQSCNLGWSEILSLFFKLFFIIQGKTQEPISTNQFWARTFHAIYNPVPIYEILFFLFTQQN